jgi:hypothetical protein
MKLYHGTTVPAAEAITSDGFVPRGRRGKGNWRHSVESHPDGVYFTNAYALYFALAALNDPRMKAGEPGVGVAVLEIDTDLLPEPGCLVPDEDCLEQVNRGRKDGGSGLPKNYGLWGMKKRTVYWRERLPFFMHSDAWKASLDAMGNCCHLGPVPASAISRVAFVDLQKAADTCFMALDPAISVMNYRFVGKRYRALTKWIFGDPLGSDEPEFLDMPDAKTGRLTMLPEFQLPPQENRAGIAIACLSYKGWAA